MRHLLHNKTFVAFLAFVLFVGDAYSQEYTLESPDGMLEMKLSVTSELEYEVNYNGATIISPSKISVTLGSGVMLGKNPEVLSTETRTVDEIIRPLLGKNKEIEDYYNELKITFSDDYQLILRAYNEGVAYRFETGYEDDIVVEDEEANFNFNGETGVIFPEADEAMRSWERSYDTYSSIEEIDEAKFSITPTLFSYDNSGVKVVVAESDLFDYPGMYLQRNVSGGMKGKWAHYPKTVSDPDDVYAYHRVTERESFIAKTSGTRKFPWRVIIVSGEDKALLNNKLIYKLARPSELSETSWIKPGKSAWEWWHDAILETSSIPSGTDNLGYDLYKYYVDFAAEQNLEYITMDAGWEMDYAGKICQYAAGKNIKVILWDFINLPIANPERLSQLKNLGAAGVKIDLIERDDQVAIGWLETLAKECAERELLLILHGCPKPTGLERTYPNIVNFEAVRGAECAKWDRTPNPDYHLQFPFIRMLAGPLDYTPGSMRNVHSSEFNPIPQGIPMTMGTRAHELAMYVIFDQPLGYLCDSPTEYRKNTIAMNFLSEVPTTWEETIPLDAKVGEHAIMAKKNGEEWFLGAMTNTDQREVEIDFSFLPDGETFNVEIYRDNDQSETDAKALTYERISVDSNSKETYSLSSGGGLVMKISGRVTGLNDQNSTEKIWVYTNPDRSELNIKSQYNLNSISIIDVSGKMRYSMDLYLSNEKLKNVNIKHFSEGVYFARVEADGQIHYLKFTK